VLYLFAVLFEKLESCAALIIVGQEIPACINMNAPIISGCEVVISDIGLFLFLVRKYPHNFRHAGNRSSNLC